MAEKCNYFVALYSNALCFNVEKEYNKKKKKD